MLDTQLAPTDDATATPVLQDEARPAEDHADENLGDEELADEVVVEISVDGMCGVY